MSHNDLDKGEDLQPLLGLHSSVEKLPGDNSLTAKQINYAIEAIEDRRAL